MSKLAIFGRSHSLTNSKIISSAENLITLSTVVECKYAKTHILFHAAWQKKEYIWLI
jgi:hypothetical protein